MAAHRQNRPWVGETVGARRRTRRPRYDPDCTSARATRASAARATRATTRIFVFDNDHPCVGPDAPRAAPPAPAFYRSRPAAGIARVVCYTPAPRPDAGRAGRGGVDGAARRLAGAVPRARARARASTHVLVFENKGEVVGVSQPAPARPDLRHQLRLQDDRDRGRARPRATSRETGRGLFQDVLAARAAATAGASSPRTSTAIAFVPYFARYAYEVYVAPAAHPPRAWPTSRTTERRDLAARAEARARAVRQPVAACRSPTCMALHQAPTDGGDHRGFHFHIEFHPPLRKPDLLKYLAGPGDRRRQLPLRHLARGEGRRAARHARACTTRTASAPMTDAARSCSAAPAASTTQIRDAVVAACEAPAADELPRVRPRGEGDTIYAVDRVSEDRLRRAGRARAGAVAAPVVLVAEGLPGGPVVLPAGRAEDGRGLARHRRSRSTARAA